MKEERVLKKMLFMSLLFFLLGGLSVGIALAEDGSTSSTVVFDAGSAVDAADEASPATGGVSGVPPAVDPENPVDMVTSIVKAIKEAKWAWMIGLIFMLLTWLVNKVFREVIPKSILPWLAMGLGVVANVALSLASSMPWYEAIGNGLSLGLAAAGGWSAIGKYLLPSS